MQEKKRKFFFCDRMSEMKEQKGQLILAVSGVKNSGKTTLIASLLSKLKQKGLKAAVIKHDGHEFEADIPGTDTWRFGEAGACGTLVFSGTKYMMVKYQPSPAFLRQMWSCWRVLNIRNTPRSRSYDGEILRDLSVIRDSFWES